jgi:hypothetical protein
MSDQRETVQPSQRCVLMLSGDLMFSSRVKSAVERAGKQFQLSGSLPAEASDAIEFVIVDLATRSGVLPELGDQCARLCPQAKLIAYGPHVQVDKLEAARQAGVPNVMTNGQFDRELTSLFN